MEKKPEKKKWWKETIINIILAIGVFMALIIFTACITTGTYLGMKAYYEGIDSIREIEYQR